jgi:hypothetical protein
MDKIYVAVDLHITVEGELRPKAIIWADGRRFEIEKVIDVRRKASLKAGGAGIRFEVRIDGKTRYLFMEDIEFNKLPGALWFVEG